MIDNIRNICRENFQAQWFATDQPESADPAWVTPIDYRFNSRGFRDSEWPDDLDHVIWAIGDSELIGTGVAQDQTTPAHLSQILGRPCVNISIIRASNDWIARQARYVLQARPSATLLLQWSFTTRSELSFEAARDHELVGLYQGIRDPSWPDIHTWTDIDDLESSIRNEIMSDPYYKKIAAMTGPQETGQIHYRKELLLDQAGAQHLLSLIAAIEHARAAAKIVHAFVPRFATADESAFIYQQLDRMKIAYIPEYLPIDLGRDQQHSGPCTHKQFARSIADILAEL